MNLFVYWLLLLILIIYIKFIVNIFIELVLYIVFDLDCSGNISLNELLIIFKSIVLGYSKLTVGADLPSYI